MNELHRLVPLQDIDIASDLLIAGYIDDDDPMQRLRLLCISLGLELFLLVLLVGCLDWLVHKVVKITIKDFISGISAALDCCSCFDQGDFFLLTGSTYWFDN